MPTNGKYWFPAKRYGYGWSVPTTWQGWLVLAVYVVLTVAATLHGAMTNAPSRTAS
jgi:hypothetical protein